MRLRRAALALAIVLATAAARAQPPDEGAARVAPPDPAPNAVLAIGGQIPADLFVTPLPAAEDVDTTLASLAGEAGKPLIVLFFSARCPVCRRYAPAVKTLAKDFDGRVRLVLVFPNATETDADVRAMLDTQGLDVLAVRDRRQDAATRLAGVVTPTALVFDGGGVLRYRGPIDDDRRNRRRDTAEHLRTAAEAIVAGKAVESPEPRAFGSSVRTRRAEHR